MACYVMALANKGDYHQPHIVDVVINKDVGTADTLLHGTRHINVSESTWDIVREGMRRAVEEPGGTGGLARVKGVVVAGKTGTAQNPHGPDHAWFVGFAPFDHPKIAIAVLVENAGFGGSYAAPIAGMCIERYLYGRLVRYDNIPHVAYRNSPDSTSTRSPLTAATGAEPRRTIAGRH
jgi:penicillin-binding protein 2